MISRCSMRAPASLCFHHSLRALACLSWRPWPAARRCWPQTALPYLRWLPTPARSSTPTMSISLPALSPGSCSTRRPSKTSERAGWNERASSPGTWLLTAPWTSYGQPAAKAMQRILVVKLADIGDVLTATPASAGAAACLPPRPHHRAGATKLRGSPRWIRTDGRSHPL